MSKPITNFENIIDVRDIIERFEIVEAEHLRNGQNPENHIAEEYNFLKTLLETLKGTGGDEQWRGDWYPGTLIRESHFVYHARELAEDCGDLEDNPRWPYTCIDWGRAALELSYDYSGCFIGNVFYYYR